MGKTIFEVIQLSSLLGLLTIIMVILVIQLGVDSYIKIKNSRHQELERTVDVLKVITKHECYQRFSANPVEFEEWIAEFLTLKGYKNAISVPKESDEGKDMIVQNRKGQNVYVLCKLRNPEDWENCINRSEAQKLTGAMVGDGVKNGLIITTAALSIDAKEYIMKLNRIGYTMQIIEGDRLAKELYNLRQKQIIPLYNSLQG